MANLDITEAQEAVSVQASPKRSPLEIALLALRGFAMGASDVVPGVSGGTMAIILGIYEELIDSIRSVASYDFIRAVLNLRIREAFERINGTFLVAVGGGILLAVLTLARALEWLLESHPVLLWSFFFGLVVASILVVGRRIERWAVGLGIVMIAAAVGVYWLVGLVPAQTPETWWFVFLSGTLAICAMILPGISGAFILVLLGKYEYILAAVNSMDILTISLVMAGAVLGLLTFAQLIGWLFKRYHDGTVALLVGLMIGSLRKLWPWKVDLAFVLDSHGRQLPVYQRNILPDLISGGSINPEVIFAVVLALLGLGLVLALDQQARRLRNAAENEAKQALLHQPSEG